VEEIDLYRVILNSVVGRGGYIIRRPRRSLLVLSHVDCLNRSHHLLDVTKLVRYIVAEKVGEGKRPHRTWRIVCYLLLDG
jgi:hypothetical protein